MLSMLVLLPARTGVVDPLGLMPLLRRGVKNIIACVATRTEPTLSMQQFAIGKSQLLGLRRSTTRVLAVQHYYY